MIKENAIELKAKIENHWNFEPINLQCSSGHINYVPQGDGTSGQWLYSDAQQSYEPDEEFLLKVIGRNYDRIKKYFAEGK